MGGDAEDRRRMLMFNRVDYSKGAEMGLKTLESAKRYISGLEVWTVGEELSDIGFVDRNLGYLSPGEMKKIFGRIGMLLCPSRHEGLPLMVLECLASGRPVVTTKAVFLLDHLKTGWVSEIEDSVALRDGITSLLLNKCFCGKLCSNGLKVARRFDIERSKKRFAKSLSDIFESL
jgi:glycosyltransferase involved in cell wall biosynthesis